MYLYVLVALIAKYVSQVINVMRLFFNIYSPTITILASLILHKVYTLDYW